MPISLPPISRRRFLAGALAAGAGLLAGENLFAGGKKIDAESWALLSDIHIAADPPRMARDINMTDNLVAVSKQILDWPARPSAVLVSGDLAFNSGETEDYAALT